MRGRACSRRACSSRRSRAAPRSRRWSDSRCLASSSRSRVCGAGRSGCRSAFMPHSSPPSAWAGSSSRSGRRPGGWSAPGGRRWLAASRAGSRSGWPRCSWLAGAGCSGPKHRTHLVCVHRALLAWLRGTSRPERFQPGRAVHGRALPGALRRRRARPRRPGGAAGARAGVRLREGPSDRALLLVEVAQWSLPQDRVTKRGIYAAAGVPEYWIVNLRDDRVEVLRAPDRKTRLYRETSIARRGERITLAALPEVSVAVDDLLLGP